MQDFEIPRWERAQRLFADAFQAGYVNAKAQLASGQLQQTGDDESVFYINVPRHQILDGEFEQYAPLFEEGGRRAALAKRRDDEEAMLEVRQDPDHRDTAIRGSVQWVVMLNPPIIAIARRR